MDFGVIQHMVVEAMGKNEVGQGEMHRNKGKENQGQNLRKLYISREGKS